MRYKVQYVTKEDKDKAIDLHKDYYLIEEQNLIDGNFLIFETEKPQPVVIYKDVPQSEFDAIQKALDELLLGGL